MLENHVTKQEALGRIKAEWKPEPGVEEIPLEQACGRILAHDYYAAYSIPVVRASGMDGIAVSFDMLQDGIPDTSRWVEGKEYVRADTGDDFPDEYDTVLPVEWITFPEDGKAGITIEPKEMPGPDKNNALRRGMNVRTAGSLIRKGTVLAPAGTEITPLDIGELATGGHGTVSVIRKPRIAFIATGTELTAPGNELQRGQNFEANSYVAKAMLEIMGAEVTAAPAVKDDKALLETTVQKAVDENDIVLISGGSSKGAEDFNWDIINRKGKQLFRWVKAAPGRPMSAAVINGKLVVNLAGPKLGAYHGIEWCVKEAISLWYTGEYGNVAWGTPVKAALGVDMPGIPLSAIVKMKVSDGIAVPVSGPGVKPEDALQDWETNAFYITDPSCAPPRKGDIIDLKLVRKASQLKTADSRSMTL